MILFADTRSQKMRTITRTHDYYDALMRSDLDKKIIFQREPKTLSMKDLDFNKRSRPYYSTWGTKENYDFFYISRGTTKETLQKRVYDQLVVDNRYVNVQSFLIGFCGTLYNGMNVKTVNRQFKDEQYSILYEEEMYDYLDKIFEHEKDSWYIKNTRNTINDMKELKQSKKVLDLFLDQRVPYFVIESDPDAKSYGFRCILNCVLKDYEFYKMFDPYQAYQEIRMFVENQLAQDTQVVVPVGDDKIIAHSKGFNKYSFRKDKQVK